MAETRGDAGPARFYKNVEIAPATMAEGGEGRALLLDGRSARTPAGAPLVAPSPALAALIAEEWRAQGETIDLRAMLATRLSTTAIDHGAARAEAWREDIINYLQTDLLCCRAASPRALAERQAAAWDPLLDWLRQACAVALATTTDLRPSPLSAEARAAARRLLEEESVYVLIGLKSAAELVGSAVLALAAQAGAQDADTLFAASRIDEDFQAARWGSDSEARARVDQMQAEFRGVAAYLRALRE